MDIIAVLLKKTSLKEEIAFGECNACVFSSALENSSELYNKNFDVL